jgi:hypothetical protein
MPEAGIKHPKTTCPVNDSSFMPDMGEFVERIRGKLENASGIAEAKRKAGLALVLLHKIVEIAHKSHVSCDLVLQSMLDQSNIASHDATHE